MVTAVGLGLLVAPAQAATPGVDLRVLVVSNGSPSVEAIATQLDRQGVPYTRVSPGEAGRAPLSVDALVDPTTGRGRYQAVVLPNADGGGLASTELSALASYERQFGVREVNAYDWARPEVGLGWATFAGTLDGSPLTVTDAAREGSFGYLRGSLTVDDVDPAVLETYGYVAAPAPDLPAGSSYTPLVTIEADTSGGTTASGSLVGVHASDGREQLVVTAAYNPSMQWFSALAPGIVSWMTKGVHLGYQRNYFAVQVDDVLLPDGRWSTAGNCTPGDDCVDPAVTTPDIRMTAADVQRLRDWQASRGFRLDMVFNGAGEALAMEETGAASDPLTDAFVAAEDEFPWVNHTSSHPYLGCIQVAPVVQGQSWHCATSPTETPRQDPTVPQQESGGVYWASQAFLHSQVADNIAFARAKGFTDFDPTELVTGEHSGLVTLPQQTRDNPFFGPALAATGVRVTASDASREPAPRAVGTATTAMPRHPMNVYYNTATYAEQIDEYNWYYTTRADGGSGICEDDPLSTCIPPLPSATAAQAKASFDGYLAPLEARNALGKVLANDPRPFYAHQSNLAEDGLLYPVVDRVLDGYASVYDTARAPLVRLDLTGQLRALERMAAWKAAADGTTAWVDGTGVHVAAAGVPVTVPAGSTASGLPLQPYAGALSGWTTGSATVALPDSVQVTKPGAPTGLVATPQDRSVALSWTAPESTGGAPLTSYTIGVFAGTSTTPWRVSVAGDVPSAVVGGLANGTTYSFTVTAVNSAGAGPVSARSAAVVPATVPGPPQIGTAVAGTVGGPVTATAAWTPPTRTGGSPVTGYLVTAWRVTSSGALADPTVSAVQPADARSLTMALPAVGPHRFTVEAVNAAGTGARSAQSNRVRGQ